MHMIGHLRKRASARRHAYAGERPKISHKFRIKFVTLNDSVGVIQSSFVFE
jgi:hypothetical protein